MFPHIISHVAFYQFYVDFFSATLFNYIVSLGKLFLLSYWFVNDF